MKLLNTYEETTLNALAVGNVVLQHGGHFLLTSCDTIDKNGITVYVWHTLYLGEAPGRSLEMPATWAASWKLQGVGMVAAARVSGVRQVLSVDGHNGNYLRPVLHGHPY